MINIFYVYEIEDRNLPYVTSSILPNPWIREVRRFAKGRASDREAIRRVLNVELSPEMSTAEIKAFIAQKLYNTPKWRRYISVRDDVEKEIHMKEFWTKLVYTLKIESEEELSSAGIKLLPKRYGKEQ